MKCDLYPCWTFLRAAQRPPQQRRAKSAKNLEKESSNHRTPAVKLHESADKNCAKTRSQTSYVFHLAGVNLASHTHRRVELGGTLRPASVSAPASASTAHIGKPPRLSCSAQTAALLQLPQRRYGPFRQWKRRPSIRYRPWLRPLRHYPPVANPVEIRHNDVPRRARPRGRRLASGAG